MLLLLLLAAACRIEPPAGRIVCVNDSDCPNGFYCSELSSGSKRCTRQRWDAQVPLDARVDDSAIDAADGASHVADTGIDSGQRTGVVDAAPDTSIRKPPDPPPRERDSGHDPPDPPVGMEIIPSFISKPLPECGREPEYASGYFVSAGVGQDVANCGGPQGPCRSLSKALQRSVDDGVIFVYLDNTDVYVETATLRLPPDTVVVGGFSNVNGRWTRLCGAARGKTRLASSGNPAVLAEYAGSSKLAALSVETRTANPGESMLGVLARGPDTKLWLDEVLVLVADGGEGAPGASGVSGGVLNASCEPADGAAGESVGGSGNSAGPGSFGPDGYLPGHGESGADGAFGHAGALGADPGCITCQVPCCNLTGDPCAQRGAPGCGGAAGGGGSGGVGGGSSVALFAWDAHVFVSRASLRAGSGGRAGDGGAAGSGSVGQLGTAGAPGASCACIDLPEAGCFGAVMPGLAGSQGGDGGPGRDGGPGGAGAGGHAYAAYRGGAAEIVIDADTLLEVGQAGASSAGAPGQASVLGPVQ